MSFIGMDFAINAFMGIETAVQRQLRTIWALFLSAGLLNGNWIFAKTL